MKAIQSLLFLSLLIAACRHPVEKRSRFENLAASDSICIREVAQAKKDLAKGKLVFCDYRLYPYGRAEVEMAALLEKFNVLYKKAYASDVIVEGHTNNCYGDFMQEQIDFKYGDGFTDSLQNIADSLFISKHLDEVYSYGTYDVPPVFPGDIKPDERSHEGLQAAFDTKVVYPTTYKYNPEGNSLSLVQIYVDIDETGKAKVKNYDFVYWNSITKEERFNKDVYKRFAAIFVPLIENTKWIPAKTKSFSVKSENEIAISLK